MKINCDDCWVVSSSGFMLGPSTPDWFYTTEEEAQREAKEAQARFPTLTFKVYRLTYFMEMIAEAARTPTTLG